MKVNTAELMRSVCLARIVVYCVYQHQGEDGWCQVSQFYTRKSEVKRAKRREAAFGTRTDIVKTHILPGEVEEQEFEDALSSDFIPDEVWIRRRNKRLVSKWKRKGLHFFKG